MSKSKLVYPGAFVHVRPGFNKDFVPVDTRCQVCERMSCATAYMHIGTKTLVCDKCMGDPWECGVTVALLIDADPTYGGKIRGSVYETSYAQ